MSEDERLREALLELQLLREREARTLSETQTLLDCLEDYTGAANAGEALSAIFVSLQQKLGASLSLILGREDDGTPCIMACDAPEWLGQRLTPPFDPFTRPRNISDLAVLGAWSGGFDPTPFKGLIVAPASEALALLSFRAAPQTFRKDDVKLVSRLAGLAAQALRNSEIAAENTLLAATIAGSSSGFAISDATDPAQPLIYVNKAFERISGYSAAEVLGQNCRVLSAEAEDSPERARLREAVRSATGGTFLLRNRRKNGEMFWNELTLSPVYDAQGVVKNLVATQSDVTDRQRATAERDLVRDRMESALAATTDAFLVLDADGSVSFANGAVNRFFPAPDLQWRAGSSFRANWDAFVQAHQHKSRRVSSLLRAGDIERLSAVVGAQDLDLPGGRSVLVRASKLQDGGMVLSASDVTEVRAAQSLLSQRLAAIEAAPDGIAIEDAAGKLTYLNSAGLALLSFSSAAQALGACWRDQYAEAPRPQGNSAFEITLSRMASGAEQTHEIIGSPLEGGGSVIVIRDVTDSLQTEAREEELTRELIRLQRQEAIAQLTAGVAHDFNNLLSAINGSALLIGMAQDLPPEAQPHLERIQTAGAQSAKLVSRLLDVGADSEADGVFELASVLADLPAVVQASLPASVVLNLPQTTPALALRGNPGMLSQILINFILNARDAFDGRSGSVRLDVQAVQGAQEQDLAVGALKGGADYARIVIADTGAGMRQATAEQIFQPYYTTKGRHGTGLGLATAALQIRSLGGGIAVQTAPGKGTTFTLYWPLAKAVASAPDTDAATGADLGGLTIMVVDDDQGVSDVVSSYLEALGAEVACCNDPRDAASAIAEDPRAWSALVTDYDMPHLNGGALVAKLRPQAPDLPVIVVTALAKGLSDPRLGPDQVSGIFPKPIDLVQLSQALALACKHS